NGFGTSQAELTFTIDGMIWFVDSEAAAGDGRLTSPFNTLASFVDNAADEEGDAIFLYERATEYTGGITLLDEQRLIGQDATEDLATVAGVTVPPHSRTLPAMNPGAGASPVL